MSDEQLKILSDVFLVLAFTILIIHVIIKYLIKREDATLSGFLYVALLICVIAGFPRISSYLEEVFDGMARVFDTDGTQLVPRYFEKLDNNIQEKQDDEWYENVFESVSYILYSSGSWLVRAIDKVAYILRDLALTVMILVSPLVIAMSVIEAHKGKLAILIGLMIQFAAWSAGWVFFANIAEDTANVIFGSPHHMGLDNALGTVIYWFIWIIIYTLIVILGTQKLYDMGVTLGSGGPSIGGGVGKAAQGGATAIRTGAAAATGVGAAALAAGAGAKAVGSGGAGVAKKAYNRIRRGGIITPTSPKNNVIT